MSAKAISRHRGQGADHRQIHGADAFAGLPEPNCWRATFPISIYITPGRCRWSRPLSRPRIVKPPRWRSIRASTIPKAARSRRKNPCSCTATAWLYRRLSDLAPGHFVRSDRRIRGRHAARLLVFQRARRRATGERRHCRAHRRRAYAAPAECAQIENDASPGDLRGLDRQRPAGQFRFRRQRGNLYRKTSFLLDSLGQTIFAPSVQIIERPHIPRALGSSPFDNEGVATHDRDVIATACCKAISSPPIPRASSACKAPATPAAAII